MKVGVTATRHGLTPHQIATAAAQLRELWDGGYRELHHGDCLGGDVQLADLAKGLGMRLVSHPPTNPIYRAYVMSEETRNVADYLVRNHELVNEVDVLIGCPDGPERQRSGTWATIRYGWKIEKPTLVVRTDGDVYVRKAAP